MRNQNGKVNRNGAWRAPVTPNFRKQKKNQNALETQTVSRPIKEPTKTKVKTYPRNLILQKCPQNNLLMVVFRVLLLLHWHSISACQTSPSQLFWLWAAFLHVLRVFKGITIFDVGVCLCCWRKWELLPHQLAVTPVWWRFQHKGLFQQQQNLR